MSARLPQKTASLGIDVAGNLAGQLRGAIVEAARQHADEAIDDTYRALHDAIDRIEHFSGTVAELRGKAVPIICDQINRAIDSEISKVVNEEVERRCPGLTPDWVKDRFHRNFGRLPGCSGASAARLAS